MSGGCYEDATRKQLPWNFGFIVYSPAQALNLCPVLTADVQRRHPPRGLATVIGATPARVLASQAEDIVRTGKTWPQATKRRN